MSWAAGCHFWTCEDEGMDEDVRFGNQIARVFHSNNGQGWDFDTFSGQASSYHWVEGESFSDSGSTNDNSTSYNCRETR
jgi:hypothetical protein